MIKGFHNSNKQNWSFITEDADLIAVYWKL